ncbi:ABC transporter ATP-binding protein [Conyzicola nivalis]|uniref:ABC transporter ATP-binding protein n=1 Tax=Conyzicola nivalis TaxID=1477021 RepID=A0A916SGJ1_9MICO|nr:ABC transporter ATP-binding protein [Conyzicola nivalis]GGA98927.1 ABC transporter ATP-binding protein [Conyzicola nivalis]
MSLLSVSNLSVRFGAATVVSGVSFDVQPGECVGIVGESGSGKSVTARALLGLAGKRARVTADALTFSSTEIQDASPRRLRSLRGREIGYVSQGALVALDPLRPVGREISDPLRLHTSSTPAQRRARVLELLADVGVPEPQLRTGQRPDELSGGLRQRAVIASAIALRPRLLIADEPTTALDSTVQAGILDLLERLRDEGTALVLISHDLAVVSRLASRVLVMNAGQIVESGPTAQVLGAPQHPYTRRLIAAVPTDRPRGSRLTAPAAPPAPAAGPATSETGTVGNSGSRVADDPQTAVSTPAATAPPEFPNNPVVVTASHLSRRFGDRLAVDDVSFTLERGRTLGVVGESGSGKTTVARLVLALDRPDSGDVHVLGRPWTTATERERRPLRPRIGAIYQDALSSFDPRLTVGRILADALSHGRSTRAGDEVARLLGRVGLDASVAARRPLHLSGGQQQRVAIARAIAAEPDVIVCDEPVSSLDVSVQAQVLDLLDDLQRDLGISYLFITHDLGVVRHVSDEVLVMQHGRVVERGSTEAVFADPREEYTRALFASAPRIAVWRGSSPSP